MSHKAMCYLWKSYDCESFEIRSHNESCSPSNYNLKQGSPLQGHQHRTVLFRTQGRNSPAIARVSTRSASASTRESQTRGRGGVTALGPEEYSTVLLPL